MAESERFVSSQRTHRHLYRTTAKYTLKSFREGRLNTDWWGWRRGRDSYPFNVSLDPRRYDLIP
jgi:hypothetical protein